MTFLIAAAGTGGHVFPGLSVGEALLELGVPQHDIMFVGGDRLESEVYPSHGFRFLQVELAGLKRSLAIRNARIPAVVMRARARIATEMATAGVGVALGMGGYVTIPTVLAARSRRVPFFNAEQNAEAGLANKIAARWARETFVSFPHTGGLPGATWVGNPVRRVFWDFDRDTLRPGALDHYGMSDAMPTLGVFGGSLGAGVINESIAAIVASWDGLPLQVVHLTGAPHIDALMGRPCAERVRWLRLGFEDRMELFYAVSDVVVARAGGAVAELTATATPSILVPGRFGSAGHQEGNARALEGAGAALVVPEESLGDLGRVVGELLSDRVAREEMTVATRDISKPQAALTIARAMIEATR